MASKDNINSLIGEGSIFEGNFYIEGSLQINGKFEGEIKTNEEIIIGETGKVRTNIAARRVTVGGTLIGNIKASEEVVLLETGRILGDISTPILHLNKGVVVQGKITITGGQKKDTKKIIEESYSAGPVVPGFGRAGKKSIPGDIDEEQTDTGKKRKKRR